MCASEWRNTAEILHFEPKLAVDLLADCADPLHAVEDLEDEDRLAVCVRHRRFIPCRPCAQEGSTEFWTTDSDLVAVVREYQSGDITALVRLHDAANGRFAVDDFRTWRALLRPVSNDMPRLAAQALRVTPSRQQHPVAVVRGRSRRPVPDSCRPDHR